MLSQRIAEEFGVPRTVIDTIVDSAPYRYKVYSVAKKTGKGKRVIAQPSKEVKAIQRYLIGKVINDLPLHNAAMAYREGKGIKDNAANHVDGGFLLKMDFERFFPSLRSTDLERHIEEFTPKKFEKDDLRVIGQVCFWKPRRKSSLQLSIGACSSPFISNTLLYRFDEFVERLAGEREIIYTRYADDLTLSTSKRGRLRVMEKEIREIVSELPYPRLKINDEKTIHTSKKHQRRVTGLILSSQGKISLGRKRKRDISAGIYYALQGKLDPEEVERLRGLLAFSLDVEPDFVARMGRKYGEKKMAPLLRKDRE